MSRQLPWGLMPGKAVPTHHGPSPSLLPPSLRSIPVSAHMRPPLRHPASLLAQSAAPSSQSGPHPHTQLLPLPTRYSPGTHTSNVPDPPGFPAVTLSSLTRVSLPVALGSLARYLGWGGEGLWGLERGQPWPLASHTASSFPYDEPCHLHLADCPQVQRPHSQTGPTVLASNPWAL